MENHSPALPPSAWPTHSPARKRHRHQPGARLVTSWPPGAILGSRPRAHARPQAGPWALLCSQLLHPDLKASPGLRSPSKVPGPFSAPQNPPEPLTLSFYLSPLSVQNL